MSPPCAGCKFLRRKCTRQCIFAPYFPPDQREKFEKVHRVFGASNVSKILIELPRDQREAAANSLAYEADARLRDPIYGCVGYISILQQRLRRIEKDLSSAKNELSTYIGPAAFEPLVPPPGQAHHPAAPQQRPPYHDLHGASSSSARPFGVAGMGFGMGTGMDLAAGAGPSAPPHHAQMQQLQQMAEAQGMELDLAAGAGPSAPPHHEQMLLQEQQQQMSEALGMGLGLAAGAGPSEPPHHAQMLLREQQRQMAEALGMGLGLATGAGPSAPPQHEQMQQLQQMAEEQGMELDLAAGAGPSAPPHHPQMVLREQQQQMAVAQAQQLALARATAAAAARERVVLRRYEKKQLQLLAKYTDGYVFTEFLQMSVGATAAGPSSGRVGAGATAAGPSSGRVGAGATAAGPSSGRALVPPQRIGTPFLGHHQQPPQQYAEQKQASPQHQISVRDKGKAVMAASEESVVGPSS